LSKNAADEKIWEAIYELVTPSTPPCRPEAYTGQTPRTTAKTSCPVNTSEYRGDFDVVLKKELHSSLYVDVARFFEAFFFGQVTDLKSMADINFHVRKGLDYTNASQILSADSMLDSTQTDPTQPDLIPPPVAGGSSAKGVQSSDGSGLVWCG